MTELEFNPAFQGSCGLKLRTILVLVMTLLVAVTAAAFSLVIYERQKQTLLEGIDAKLLAVAQSAHSLLPADFHDRIEDKSSVSSEDYLRIVDQYNKLSLKTGLQYIWSLMDVDKTIVFTTGTSTSKDVENGDHALFFDVHSNPEAYAEAFRTMEIQYTSFHDEWGAGRMVSVPGMDTRGRKFLFASSMSINEVDELMVGVLKEALMIGFLMIAFGALLSFTLADALARPLRHLSDVAQKIAAGNFDQSADMKGSSEQRSLSASINEMGRAICERIDNYEEAQEELRCAHDTLDQRVRERTRDLKSEIAERESMEEALRESERRFHAIFNQTFEFIGLMNPDGVLIEANSSSLEYAGIDPGDVIGKPFWETVWWTHSPQAQDKLKDAVKRANQGEFVRFETTHPAPDGSVIHVDFSLKPIRDKNGKIELLIPEGRDITDLKKAEFRLRLAKDEAEMANRSKSEFLANMSHELRTPLNAILGFSSAMLEQVFGPIRNPKYEEYTNNIFESGEHLLELINEILDLSKVEAGVLELDEEATDLGKISESVIRLIRPRAENGRVKLVNKVNGRLPFLRGDERRIKQILFNLLSNAVKFSNPGDNVTLDARINKGETITAVVSDTGIGMDEKELKIALSPFGQVDGPMTRKHEGTGLGLPLTQALVELHNGQMDIQSIKGKGTRVSIEFPKERVVRRV